MRRCVSGAGRAWRCRVLAGLIALALVWAPVRASAWPQAADAPAEEPTLGLLDALRLTFEHSPEIAVAVQQHEASRGVLEAERGRFDTLVEAQAGRRHETTPGLAGAATADTTRWDAGLSRELRSGLRVAPLVVVERLNGAGASAGSQASVKLTFTQPLLRGRGASAVAALETAAASDVEAAALRLRQAFSERALGTLLAYWDYRAAQETVRIQRGAEERARVFLDEERRLVEGKERAPSDIFPVRANLADARAARADAERVYEQARLALGLALGLDWRAIARLPPAGDGFDVARAAPAGEIDVEALVRLALERRSDLRASRADRRAAEIRLVAARRALEPQLDLATEVGYGGLSRGGGLVAPLAHGLVGPNLFAGLVFAFPVRNRTAHGALLQQQALERQSGIGADDLARRIAANVALTLRVLQASQRQLEYALEAVAAFRVAKNNEVTRLRSNLSTTFDVLQIDSRLTAAELSLVNGQQRVVEALARLRFETGTLVEAEPGGGSLTLQTLTSLPEP